jgi:hypothetical protein
MTLTRTLARHGQQPCAVSMHYKKIIMKRIIFLLYLTLFVSTLSWGQHNPIRNLYWHTMYDEYYNYCLTLSWNTPNPSLTDSLIGYNIYRDDSLYEFTTDTMHLCNVCISGPYTNFCDFINYNWGYFYIHVTAVYNHDSIESLYNDSAQNNGIAIGIKNYVFNDLNILNISQTNSSLTIEFNKTLDNGSLIVLNYLGQEIKKLNLQKGQKEINFNSPNSGIYFIIIKTSNEYLIKKISIK